VTVEEYLYQLGRLLPGSPIRRRRALAEVEDHLREAAEHDGEAEAIERFGPPAEVARAFADEAVVRTTVGAAGVLVLCLAGFLGAYVMAEHALPPAPWASAADAPDLLRWTVAGATWLFVAAAAAGGFALVLLAVGRARMALPALGAASAALATASVLTLVGGLRRAELYEQLEVAGRLTSAQAALGAIYLVSLAALAVGAAGWALRVSWTAQRASRS
jgi:hypothetical protein